MGFEIFNNGTMLGGIIIRGIENMEKEMAECEKEMKEIEQLLKEDENLNKNSYVTCKCGEIVYRKNGQYICRKCGEKIKSTCRGWGHE